ncbi:hypothetical protein V6N13_128992 [Hibiscus sabdariffa]|uniref:RING-type domain-containing protein n=1 Tax=Hibiscus sabdariffa TaxID=183260 RepID=A0ABR2SJR9_9ROSI
MGNKLGRKRQVVDERYTRPQGSDLDIDVDIKKLRKLILESKLAPCYPGDEECCSDLEECPICFLYYPSLNRSRCCTKSICTECFLQMKNPNSARPTQCPFCKTPSYAVEYRGVKTKEEKGMEQLEEQLVKEAQLRMRQRELQDEEERMQKRQVLSSVSAGVEEVDSLQDFQAALMNKQPSNRKTNRDGEFDLDLEDIMVAEAIWQSMQDGSGPRNSNRRDAASSVQYVSSDHYMSPAMTTVAGSSSSASAGRVCAVAAFAEHQPAQSPVDMSANGGMTPARDEGEWGVDHGSESEVIELGTRCARSNVTQDASAVSQIPQADETRSR